jgi:hypothetical protein
MLRYLTENKKDVPVNPFSKNPLKNMVAAGCCCREVTEMHLK